jgi:formylglycine-generating enzyme required for sulfatase activity
MMNLSHRISLAITAVSALLAASCRVPSDGTAETKASVATPADVAEVHRGISGKEFINSIGMKLVLIPKGEFAMGSARGNPNSDGDERHAKRGDPRSGILPA